MCPTRVENIRHCCKHWERHAVPAPWPASAVYTGALAELPCTGCIARGTLGDQVRQLLDGIRRDLFAKGRPGRVYRMPAGTRRRPAA